MVTEASRIFDPVEQLREAKRYMAELREDYRSANGRRPRAAAAAGATGRRSASPRLALGRAIIGLGRALAGAEEA